MSTSNHGVALLQQRFGSTSTLYLYLRVSAFDLPKFIRREDDIDSAEIFFQVLEICRTQDRDNPGLLREQPGERDVCAPCG